MATTRMRRAGAANTTIPADVDGDRVYTKEDYAAKEPLPDEWDADSTYAVGWTVNAPLPDEAFEPDDKEETIDADWAAAPVQAPYEDEYIPLFDAENNFDNNLDPLDDELLTEEELAELRRSHWQLLAGLGDFAGIILGTAAILVLVALLVSLLNWLIGDLSQSFILLQKNF